MKFAEWNAGIKELEKVSQAEWQLTKTCFASLRRRFSPGQPPVGLQLWRRIDGSNSKFVLDVHQITAVEFDRAAWLLNQIERWCDGHRDTLPTQTEVDESTNVAKLASELAGPYR